MLKQSGRIFLFLLFSLLWDQAFGGGFENKLQGPRQIGMGLAGTAYVFDPSVIYYNPGGLVFLSGGQVQFNASFYWANTTYLELPPGEYTAETGNPLTTPASFFGSWRARYHPFWKKVAFGIGFYSPFAGGARWPEEWRGRFVATEFAISSFFLQPTISIRLGNRWGLGGGPLIGLGNYLFRRAISPDNQEGKAAYAGSSIGFGAVVGLYFEASTQLKVGLNFRSTVKLAYTDGEATFTVPPALLPSFEPRPFGSSFTLPWSLTAGMVFQAQERLMLTADLAYTGWSTYDTITFSFEPPTQSVPSESQPKNYRNTVSLRLGGEYTANEKLRIRAGLFYEPSPVPDGLVSPELPDANRVGFTGGLSLQVFYNLRMEFSGVYELTGARTSIFLPSGFGGTYKSNAYQLGVGATFSF